VVVGSPSPQPSPATSVESLTRSALTLALSPRRGNRRGNGPERVPPLGRPTTSLKRGVNEREGVIGFLNLDLRFLIGRSDGSGRLGGAIRGLRFGLMVLWDCWIGIIEGAGGLVTNGYRWLLMVTAGRPMVTVHGLEAVS
jgi:hypothetical protein